MAKLLLLTPPMRMEEMFARGSESTASITPPLGLAYIASYVMKFGHQVRIIDGIVEPHSFQDLINIAKDYDIVGISIVTVFYKRARELTGLLKSHFADKLIIVGGPHVSAMPDDILLAGADIVAIGEGEATILEIMNAYADKTNFGKKTINGIAYLDVDGNVVKTAKRNSIEPLDEIPMPSLNLLPMEKYSYSVARSGLSPSLPIIATRGCDGICTYCNHRMFGKNIRRHSPLRVIQEFFRLRDEFGANSVALVDDNFVSNKSYVNEVCDGLISAKFDKPFSVQARVDSIDEPLLRQLKKAGCDHIAYGFESGSSRILDYVKKKETLTQMIEAVSITKKVGLSIRGYFILGFPGESIEEMNMTVDFAKKLDIDIASFSLLIPLPGTVEYSRAKKSGQFDPYYFSEKIVTEFHFLDSPVYIPDGITSQNLMMRHQSSYNEYYFRVKPILRELLKIRSVADISRLYRASRTLIANFIFKPE